MIVLAVALVIGLITVIYTSVSKYARRLDPGAAKPRQLFRQPVMLMLVKRPRK